MFKIVIKILVAVPFLLLSNFLLEVIDPILKNHYALEQMEISSYSVAGIATYQNLVNAYPIFVVVVLLLIFSEEIVILIKKLLKEKKNEEE